MAAKVLGWIDKFTYTTWILKKKGTEEHGRKMQIAKVGRKLSVQVNKQTEESFYQY